MLPSHSTEVDLERLQYVPVRYHYILDSGEFTIGRAYRSLILPKPLKKISAVRLDRIRNTYS